VYSSPADIRESVGDRTKREDFEQFVARKHYITKQDVANASKRVYNHTIIRHQSDPLSVAQVVSDLQQEPYNPVLLYKPQGINDPNHPKITADGFILGIQTQFQKELYEKYGHTILCIDATHGTNAYRFMLITCIVPDEFGRGESVCDATQISWSFPTGQPYI
jgi:hypothetical protein